MGDTLGSLVFICTAVVELFLLARILYLVISKKKKITVVIAFLGVVLLYIPVLLGISIFSKENLSHIT